MKKLISFLFFITLIMLSMLSIDTEAKQPVKSEIILKHLMLEIGNATEGDNQAKAIFTI